MTEGTRIRSRRMRTVVTVAMTLSIVATIAITSPATAVDNSPTGSADDGPTWADVDNAKNDIAATQTLITEINSRLSSAQKDADLAGDAATVADAAAATAREKAAAAAAQLTTLNAQLANAQSTYASVVHAAGGAIVAASRSSGEFTPDLQVFLSDNPDAILAALTMSDRVSSITANLVSAARRAHSVVEALTASAAEQSSALSTLATEATAAATEANTRNAEADTAVAQETENANTLYAKLATLQNTTAADIAAIHQREAEAASFAAQQAAAEQAARDSAAANAAASGGSGTGSGSSSGGSSGGASSGSGPSNTGSPPGGSNGSSSANTPAAAQAYAKTQMAPHGWDATTQFSCLVNLWTRESSWRYTATNSSSGAYGIPQALPGSKMASAGADWRTNAVTQIDWGLGYITSRYGTPCSAWQHSQDTGWY